MMYRTPRLPGLTRRSQDCNVVPMRPEQPARGEGKTTMTKTARINGRLIRTVARVDRKWRIAGQDEGATENALAMYLGRAYQAGLGDKARRVQSRNAARQGQTSGWE